MEDHVPRHAQMGAWVLINDRWYKTSVAERIGQIFSDIIYVPYAFHVEGQIIKVFDVGVHNPVEKQDEDRPQTL